MTLKMLRNLVIFTVVCVGKAQECPQINISCPDIKTDNGFKFSYDCPQPSQGGWTTEVTDNETKIAQAPPFVHSPQVTSFDNSSITTRECRDLHVKCIDRGERVRESCWHLKTEEVTSPDPSHSPKPQDSPSGGSHMKVPPWVIVVILLILLIGIIMITLMLCLRKKKVKKWCSYQLARLRPKTSQAVRTEETGEPLSAPDDTLESVCADSIDLAPDGETPESFSPDRTLSNGRIQESKNGDTTAPDVNGAYNHGDIHRYMRDDPGGVNDNRGKGALGNKKMRNGWAVGDRGPEDENGGQPLLLNPRAAIQDKTGETVSVYEHSFGTERVRRCSTSLDADVESTANTKNIKT
ncbi:uncharacterized protein [Pagrus major]|uniref:uncharacterized protein n=1 Tax=Pagrus major TaxID=143350 RepID=UPI003CC8ACB4